MNERAFAERRKPVWDRFEQMIKAVRWSGAKGLSREELNELGRLYRQVAADLAYARTHSVGSALTDYLNALLSQAHGVLYKSPSRGFRQGLIHYFYEVPAVVRRRGRYVAVSIGITLLGGLFAAMLVASNPEWTARLMDERIIESLNHWKSGQQYTPGDSDRAAFMSSFYFVNNTRVTMLAFGLGFFWAVPTVWLMWTNGMMLGVFSAEMASVGKLGFFYTSIFPHGVPELAAVFFGGAGGLIMGRALLMPGDRTRIEALREEGRDAFYLLAGSLPLLLIAAFTEAFFSFYKFPAWTKLLYGSVLLVLLTAYWFGVKRRVTS